jgi:hypothetical protein
MPDRFHLSEAEIEALLDGALTPDETRRARQHVATCAECGRRLEAAERLFLAIESWEEVPVPGDFSPEVVRSLRQNLPVGLRVATAVQAGLVLVILLTAWPVIAALLPPLAIPRLPDLEVGLLPALGAQARAWLVSAWASGQHLQASLDRLTRLAPSWVGLWPAIVAAAALAAVVGNSILLAGRAADRPRPRRL